MLAQSELGRPAAGLVKGAVFALAICYISWTLRIAPSLDGKMNKATAIFISVLISGCALEPKVYPKAKPYDNPAEGYIVYKPYAGYQRWDGMYLSGFYSSGWQYLDNCVATGPLVPDKHLQASIRYSDKDDVVYLNYAGGPSRAKCDIKYDVIKLEVDKYIVEQSASNLARIDAEIEERKQKDAESKRKEASNRGTKVEFGGFVATREDILTSVLLACYSGSLDSDDKWIPREEQAKRYKDLLGLYEGDVLKANRITNAYNFARRNLSDRYPLDTMARYRGSVCDQMVMKGKL